MEKTIKQLKARVKKQPTRSAWTRGVKAYAIDLLEEIEPYTIRQKFNTIELHKRLLNGADSRSQYSRGGCSYIYNYDIAKRLCSPSEFKKTDKGNRRPNRNEERLDTQARALHQAEYLILRAYK